MSSPRRTILENLDNRVHPINEWCTIAGLDHDVGLEEINRMLREALIELHYNLGMRMYKLSYLGRQMNDRKVTVVVDNTQSV